MSVARAMASASILLTTVLGGVGAADTHKFEPKAGVPTFAVREPVLRVKPGDIVETRTFSKPDDYYARAGGAWPGEVGPFAIEGATPNDTLVVKILRLRPNRDTAVSAVNPSRISAVAGDGRTRMLNDPLPARRFVWRLDLDAQRRHPRHLPNVGEQADRVAAQADARTRRRGAGRRRGLGRSVAGQLRRQHGRLGRRRGNDGLLAHFS